MGRSEGGGMPVAVLSVVTAIVAFAIAAATFIRPEETAGSIGYALLADKGLAEFITLYGGFYVGFGIFYLIAAATPGFRSGAMLLLMLTNLGAGTARAAVMLGSDAVASMTIYLLIGEAVLAVMGYVGWRLARR